MKIMRQAIIAMLIIMIFTVSPVKAQEGSRSTEQEIIILKEKISLLKEQVKILQDTVDEYKSKNNKDESYQRKLLDNIKELKERITELESQIKSQKEFSGKSKKETDEKVVPTSFRVTAPEKYASLPNPGFTLYKESFLRGKENSRLYWSSDDKYLVSVNNKSFHIWGNQAGRPLEFQYATNYPFRRVKYADVCFSDGTTPTAFIWFALVEDRGEKFIAIESSDTRRSLMMKLDERLQNSKSESEFAKMFYKASFDDKFRIFSFDGEWAILKHDRECHKIRCFPAGCVSSIKFSCDDFLSAGYSGRKYIINRFSTGIESIGDLASHSYLMNDSMDVSAPTELREQFESFMKNGFSSSSLFFVGMDFERSKILYVLHDKRQAASFIILFGLENRTVEDFTRVKEINPQKRLNTSNLKVYQEKDLFYIQDEFTGSDFMKYKGRLYSKKQDQGLVLFASEDEILLYSVEEMKPVAYLGLFFKHANYNNVAISSSGKYIAFNIFASSIGVWDLSNFDFR